MVLCHLCSMKLPKNSTGMLKQTISQARQSCCCQSTYQDLLRTNQKSVTLISYSTRLDILWFWHSVLFLVHYDILWNLYRFLYFHTQKLFCLFLICLGISITPGPPGIPVMEVENSPPPALWKNPRNPLFLQLSTITPITLAKAVLLSKRCHFMSI